jgi:hypothetical protein
MNAICHCRDCVGFNQACDPQEDGSHGTRFLTPNQAAHNAQFYHSDIQVVSGQEYLGKVRLHDKSYFVGCYCRKCGTPLGGDMIYFPLSLVSAHLFRNNQYSIEFLPRYVFFWSSALPNTKPYDRNAIVCQGIMAPLFLWKVIVRAVLGFLFGKNPGGFLNGDFASIPVGIDQVKIEKKSKHQ